MTISSVSLKLSLVLLQNACLIRVWVITASATSAYVGRERRLICPIRRGYYATTTDHPSHLAQNVRLGLNLGRWTDAADAVITQTGLIIPSLSQPALRLLLRAVGLI